MSHLITDLLLSVGRLHFLCRFQIFGRHCQKQISNDTNYHKYFPFAYFFRKPQVENRCTRLSPISWKWLMTYLEAKKQAS